MIKDQYSDSDIAKLLLLESQNYQSTMISHWEFSQQEQEQRQQPQQQQLLKQQQNLAIQHWDSLSPLTDLEKQSIQSIQKATSEKPLPALIITHRNQQPLNTFTPPLARSSSPSSSLRQLIKHQSTNPDHISEQEIQPPIASINRFNDWFATVSSQIEANSESAYLNHLSILSTYSNACDSLDQAIDNCCACLNEIEVNWKFVNENSKSLERSCQGMLDDQKVLGSIATALSNRLTYFRWLDEAQRILSRPG
ncbi:hypothetical protein MJO29_012962 [Puccinia striiformis f. sp. tritici]|nr:hypothetical protein Pst134EB_025099 [Puccinia striiformis f. sp. tritici]KAI7943118.1 hypothetical protein MJO29_012962 [Puccinia striiformis f. sp. tritici]KAI9619594.1 hypothetical protein KEM48_006240 [Puccinia striiformis f. sp. tritici PST-130]